MLRNVPVNKLIEVLLQIQKESALCNIEIDEDKPGIIFRAVTDPSAIVKTKVETPKDPPVKKNLDIDDLGKYIV